MLHDDLKARIEKLVGAKIESYQAAGGGYTPALRLRCQTASGSFFAKVATTPLVNKFIRRETQMYRQLQGPFLPELVAWEDDEQESILIIEDLSAHYWPPPWDERRVELVLAQIEAMHNSTAAIETFAEVHAATGQNWHTIAADPEPFLSLNIATAAWLDRALPHLLEATARCQTEGNSLTHWDIRSDNICITPNKALFIDWNLACLANPTLDLGFWLPSLAYEGGPLPDQILPDAPEVAAWVSGFFAARAGLSPIPDAPRVRLVQQQQLETALPWAIRALDLPPL